LKNIEGEVELHAYVRAQTSPPAVVKRITELENCLWRLAVALNSMNLDRPPELRAALEETAFVPKNRLEADDGKRFHSDMGVFKDELRIIKK